MPNAGSVSPPNASSRAASPLDADEEGDEDRPRDVPLGDDDRVRDESGAPGRLPRRLDPALALRDPVATRGEGFGDHLGGKLERCRKRLADLAGALQVAAAEPV